MSEPKPVNAAAADEGSERAAAGPFRGLIDGVTNDLDRPEGVAVESLEPGTVLEVQTRNTCYRMVLVDGSGHALIKGGTFFPLPTPVHIEGASAGGGNLKVGWIGVGLNLELSVGSRVITTSPVKSVEPIAA
jgi:hypothetical protein